MPWKNSNPCASGRIGVGLYKNSRKMVFGAILLSISCIILSQLSGVAFVAGGILLFVTTVILYIVSEHKDY